MILDHFLRRWSWSDLITFKKWSFQWSAFHDFFCFLISNPDTPNRKYPDTSNRKYPDNSNRKYPNKPRFWKCPDNDIWIDQDISNKISRQPQLDISWHFFSIATQPSAVLPFWLPIAKTNDTSPNLTGFGS
jgi:hypothetical protein